MDETFVRRGKFVRWHSKLELYAYFVIESAYNIAHRKRMFGTMKYLYSVLVRPTWGIFTNES